MGFHVYVGTLSCGCSVAACVDEPRYQKDTAKSVADMIAGGMTVERVYVPDGETVGIKRCIHKEVSEPLFATQK